MSKLTKNELKTQRDKEKILREKRHLSKLTKSELNLLQEGEP